VVGSEPTVAVGAARSNNGIREKGRRRRGREGDVNGFGPANRSVQITEEIIGLGSYGKTVPTAIDLDEKVE